MTSYLERYQQGEREQVWAELTALGAGVRDEAVYPDALAVARETMTRVRANIETIVGRLNALGYLYEYPQAAFSAPGVDAAKHLEAFERKVGPLPLSVRAWCEVVGTVNLMGNHPGLAYYGSSLGAGFMNLVESNFVDMGSWIQSLIREGNAPSGMADLPPDMLKQVADQLSGMFPGFMMDAVKQQIQTEKAKPSFDINQNLEPGKVVVSDPLVVEIEPERLLDDYLDWQEYEAEDNPGYPYRFEFAPDSHHKSNQSGGGGYGLALPSPMADVIVEDEWHDTTFVNYLRICFQWGGFPGLEDYPDQRDEALLAHLKADLLPI